MTLKDLKNNLIRKGINQFNRERDFENKNLGEKVLTFNETIFNILSNFISPELIVCDDKIPPWFSAKKKKKIHTHTKKLFKVLHKSIGSNQQIKKLKFFQNHLKCVIDESQHYYSGLASKLLIVHSKLKIVLDSIRDVPKQHENTHYPPLFYENKFVTDLKGKLNYLIFFC